MVAAHPEASSCPALPASAGQAPDAGARGSEQMVQASGVSRQEQGETVGITGANGERNQIGRHNLFPAHPPARPQRQPRTLRRAVPPSDPGLRAFLEELGQMAADAILERLHNSTNAKGFDQLTIKSPRAIYSSGGNVEGVIVIPQNVVEISRHSFAVRVRERAFRRLAEGDSFAMRGLSSDGW